MNGKVNVKVNVISMKCGLLTKGYDSNIRTFEMDVCVSTSIGRMCVVEHTNDLWCRCQVWPRIGNQERRHRPEKDH